SEGGEVMGSVELFSPLGIILAFNIIGMTIAILLLLSHK
ncbi:hypothetical protein LCGC14_2092400, partial [marine sediment metagenome]